VVSAALLAVCGGFAPARCTAVHGEVLGILNERAIAIWLYDRGRYNAFRTRVQGYAPNGSDVATWNAAEWRVAN
jgi:hypothetical protein